MTISAGGEPAGHHTIKKAANAYSAEKYGITIEVRFLDWDPKTTYPIIMNTGDGVDMVWYSSWPGSPDYARQGAFMELEDYLELPEYADLKNAISETAWNDVKIDGHIYCIPAPETTYAANNGIIYRSDLCEKLNLKAIMFGGRIPNYYKYADQIRPKEYIDKVKQKEIFDPVLTFQLSNDFHVRKVMRNYLPNDEESKHYACLLQWDNIYYQAPTQDYVNPKTTVRVGLVQWQMRTYKTLDDLFEQVEFFVDAVSDYKSDFVLFPEYFNAPLMAKFNNEGESQAIRGLAAYTEEIKERFVKLAISYNINIITGSMPLIKEDGLLYNVGFLCRRDGSYEMYEKIHVTPDEIKSWGLSGGKSIQTFDTDCAKIGVLICYDVEFPELSRIMADQGMQILFVPFLTDTQNAYSRVKVCAHARAIENECFVVIAGSVGNLPRVHNMDIQYAQSGVFTPCDFAFPTDGKRAEATPNTEMILVSDVDLDLLNELHTYGSVRNLKDRRGDLYEVKMKR